MKKTLIVSNSWRPDEEKPVCGKCGAEIPYKWGEYSFRYYEKKDKSDICMLCTGCASEIKNNDKSVRVVSRGLISEMINLMNSGWKNQPKRQVKKWGASAGEDGKE